MAGQLSLGVNVDLQPDKSAQNAGKRRAIQSGRIVGSVWSGPGTTTALRHLTNRSRFRARALRARPLLLSLLGIVYALGHAEGRLSTGLAGSHPCPRRVVDHR